MQRFDILMLSDLRLRGGVSTGLVEQVKANAAAGYTTGLVNVWSAAGLPRRAADPRVRRLLDAGLLTRADAHRPIEARLVVGLHPALFANLPARPVDIRGYQKLLLVTQPPFDGYGHPSYDMRRLDDNAQEILDGGVSWAPVSPAVRALLTRAATPVPTLAEDWAGILNPDEWATRRDGHAGRRPVIGRYGRPDQLKWPDTAAETLRAYPAGDDLAVRILGEPVSVRAQLGEYPANWQVLPSRAAAPPAFLKTLDHFVYFHHSRRVDGYGYAILEAMASGAVPILPESFRAHFDGAAVYAQPKDVARTVETFRQNPARFRDGSEAAVALVRDRHSNAVHHKRLRDLIGPPRGTVSAVRRRRHRVMFLSSNGVGLGHLTRQLAIARRCSDHIEPVFVTMSPAVSVVSDFGFLCEHIPHHRHLRCDVGQWNTFLARELADKIAFYDAGAVVFDGNVVYGGVADALTGLPECWRIWCRRGMWRRGAGADSVAQESAFDLVIEPGDVADQFDAGLTTGHRKRTRRFDPIRLLDTNEQLSREAARQELSVPADKIAVLVQLGAGNNWRSRDVQEAVVTYLAQACHVDARFLEWPIADRPNVLPDAVKPIRTYPVVRYLKAFDATVSAAGYNSFHDIVANRMPAVFVPNENPMMDDQLARAHHATTHGYGLMLREHDPYRVGPALDQLLDPLERRRMQAAASRFRIKNGAGHVAGLLDELLQTVRTDRDHREDLLPAMRAKW